MNNNGSALLVTTIVITSILLVMSIAFSSISLGELNMSTDDKKAKTALSVAEAGARDGLIRVTRKKDYQNNRYVLQLNEGFATITVEPNQPVVGKTTIISQSEIDNIKKRIKVILLVDNDGKVTQESWQEEGVI